MKLVGLVLLVSAITLAATLVATGGQLILPLDDPYIHFLYGRGLVEEGLLRWSPDGGWSSGETSPAFAVLSALGYTLGFRGDGAAWWVWSLSTVIGVFIALSVRDLLSRYVDPLWAFWGAVATAGWGWLVFQLYCGMEGALGLLLVLRALLAMDRSWVRLGGWLALAATVRPELAVSTGLLGIVLFVHDGRRGRRPPLLVLLWALLPLTVWGGYIAMNYLNLGEFSTNVMQYHALVKPHSDAGLRWLLTGRNFGLILLSTLGCGLGPLVPLLVWWAWRACPRPLLLACTLLAGLAALIVSQVDGWWMQNLRYLMGVAPPLWLAGLVGWGSLHVEAGSLPTGLRRLKILTVVVWLTLPFYVLTFAVEARHLKQLHFSLVDAIQALPEPPTRLLIHDAGILTWYTGLPSLDLIGLGNDTRFPVARYRHAGVGSSYEWLEHLDPAERPSHVAVFEDWLSPIPILGQRLHEASIQPISWLDSVDVNWLRVVGSRKMTLALADWKHVGHEVGPFAPPPGQLVDELDLCDLEEEETHSLRMHWPGLTTVPRQRVLLLKVGNETHAEGGWRLPKGGGFDVDITGSTLILRAASEGESALEIGVGGAPVEEIRLQASETVYHELVIANPHGGSLHVRVLGPGPVTFTNLWGFTDHHPRSFGPAAESSDRAEDTDQVWVR